MALVTHQAPDGNDEVSIDIWHGIEGRHLGAVGDDLDGHMLQARDPVPEGGLELGDGNQRGGSA